MTAEQEGIATAAKIGEVLSDRVEYGDVIDQTLYQSADSYSQAGCSTCKVVVISLAINSKVRMHYLRNFMGANNFIGAIF